MTKFGTTTGLDLAIFGADEIAARDRGLSAREAALLQAVASFQRGFRSTVPEPGSMPLVTVALLGMTGLHRRTKLVQVPRA